MFAIVYVFPLPKAKLKTFLAIDKKADVIYRKYGLTTIVPIPYLIRPRGPKTIEIMMVSIYRSKKEYKQKIKHVDKDPRINKLFALLVGFVPRNKIKTFEYNTVV